MGRPRSMTGFGRGEAEAQGRTWIAEVRTVNHRFLDQRVVLPRRFAACEEQVKKTVAQAMDRGRVDISLTAKGDLADRGSFSVDHGIAEQYHRCLSQLQDTYELSGGITVSDMLTIRDIISQEEVDPDMDAELKIIITSVQRALLACDQMREQEGQSLKRELLERLAGFEKIVSTIETNSPKILEQRQQELQVRLAKLLSNVDIDPARLAQESAIMADKSDITEEIVRLHSHIEQFRQYLESDEAVGRRLDFLLQEFLREVNTLASKITNASIAHLGVEMKNEIEKLREQVQNIE
ncbi:YicC/YloC family endoribonuclease [Desulfogranum japonicum]|uniref:YicC/YloC family endoribonuclease n=1 Tax=Desulfogranum japonicum TaxID=231447 RepID=UPI0004271ADC|nr:YicC/YloC family endoribonuclease [Desulfogranum japonicum]